mmetsp:Transcript_15374/g.41258  ORF Transcript_15374/g.41258 Transcript_15374/m.41258 type:complete len:205 (-) Transcript_15374:841-1455(-)
MLVIGAFSTQISLELFRAADNALGQLVHAVHKKLHQRRVFFATQALTQICHHPLRTHFAQHALDFILQHLFGALPRDQRSRIEIALQSHRGAESLAQRRAVRHGSIERHDIAACVAQQLKVMRRALTACKRHHTYARTRCLYVDNYLSDARQRRCLERRIIEISSHRFKKLHNVGSGVDLRDEIVAHDSGQAVEKSRGSFWVLR